MDIREKLVGLLTGCGICFHCFPSGIHEEQEKRRIADYLIAHGVTVQEAAYWKDVMQINGECFGYCSNCLTEHKAQNYAALVMSHRYCRWCGRRLITTPFPRRRKESERDGR